MGTACYVWIGLNGDRTLQHIQIPVLNEVHWASLRNFRLLFFGWYRLREFPTDLILFSIMLPSACLRNFRRLFGGEDWTSLCRIHFLFRSNVTNRPRRFCQSSTFIYLSSFKFPNLFLTHTHTHTHTHTYIYIYIYIYIYTEWSKISVHLMIVM